MATEAQIRSVIWRTLSSPAARQINFTLGSITIDWSGLMAIASWVLNGQIGIRIKTHKMGVRARYVEKENLLSIPPDLSGATAEDRSYLVHECAHALHDLYGGNKLYSTRGSYATTVSENEAAAHIAQCLYYIYETGAAMTGVTPLYAKASQIAEAIKNQAGARVSLTDEWELRREIAAHPEYRKYGLWRLTTANG